MIIQPTVDASSKLRALRRTILFLMAVNGLGFAYAFAAGVWVAVVVLGLEATAWILLLQEANSEIDKLKPKKIL